MTLLEYYKKNVSEDIYKVDHFYINCNMIPDSEEGPYYIDDGFDVVTFENGEKKFFFEYGSYDHSLIEQDVDHWLKYGVFKYDVGNTVISETQS